MKMKKLNGKNPGVDISSHTPGTKKGEELARIKGREPGRDDPMTAWRTARDSTSINPDDMAPIDPRMPHLPPA
jgi:hypothetical protein